MTSDWFSQDAARCRLEWGRQGARDAATRGDILVVVDILRFSSAAVTALHHGAILYPCRNAEEVTALAQRLGTEVGGHRSSAAIRYSLSPLSYRDVPSGTRIALPSPNGATCVRYAAEAPYVFVGALLNAAAVARTVQQLLETSDLGVSIIACGERWQNPSEDGELRFAIEDYLGAGAILSYLSLSKSPEATLCEEAFRSTRHALLELLWECGSGRELRARGQGDDITHVAQLNLYDVVPVVREERLEHWS